MTYKPRRERRARGGKASGTQPLHLEHGHQYNAVGSPENKEEYEAPDGFKRGGRAKKHKEGGHVEGHGAKHHLGKRARGGATHPHVEMHMGEHHEHHGKHHGEHHGEGHEHGMPKRARGGHVRHKKASGGGTPFSSAHNLQAPGNDKKTGPGENTETIP